MMSPSSRRLFFYMKFAMSLVLPSKSKIKLKIFSFVCDNENANTEHTTHHKTGSLLTEILN